MKIKSIKIICFLLMVLISLALQAEAEIPEILISSEVETTNPSQILLGDIARISNVDQKIEKKLAEVELGSTPAPGFKSSLNRQLVEKEIEEKGINEYKLDMPGLIRVSLKTKIITEKDFTLFLTDYINQVLPYEQEKISIDIKYNPQEIMIPDNEYYFNINIENSEKL